MKQVVLYRAHDIKHLQSFNYKELIASDEDVKVLFDATNKARVENANNYTIDDIIKSGLELATKEQLEKAFSGELKTRFTTYESRQLWYNCGHLPVLFYLENPNYDYYWSIEYDVFFRGYWNDFFSLFKSEKDDFLGVGIKKFKDTKESSYWDLYEFDRVPYKNRITSFGTIQRYSNKLLEKVSSELKSGKHTYYEQLFPSLAKHFKMKLRDLNDIAEVYTNSTMTYSPIDLYIAINTAGGNNKLFHPLR